MNKKQLKAILAFAAKEDVRDSLNGILVDFDNRLVVASDGAMIVVHRDVENLTGEGSVIIPRFSVEMALKKGFFGDVYITPTTINYLPFAPVASKYPDYKRVIPTSFDDEFKLGMFKSSRVKCVEDLQSAFGEIRFASHGSGDLYGTGSGVKLVVMHRSVETL